MGILIGAVVLGLGGFYLLSWIHARVQRKRWAKQVNILTRGSAKGFIDWALHHEVLVVPQEEFGGGPSVEEWLNFQREEHPLEGDLPCHWALSPIQFDKLVSGAPFIWVCYSLATMRPNDVAFVAGSFARILPGLRQALVGQLCYFYDRKRLSRILEFMAHSHKPEAEKLLPMVKDELARLEDEKKRERNDSILFPAKKKAGSRYQL